ALVLDTPRTLDAVLREHSADGASYGFQRTSVPLHLLGSGATLASRAEARRASSGLAQFAHAELDFSGIEHIGHGFADELFRVFRRDHPGVELASSGMNAQVSAMLASVGR
ncbi:MAG: STAS-like domain-containing protein, partial [Chitinophagaceae bacterium]|nr:STAS-like domain-containing protein [Rubrivivax sp.]